MDERFPDRWTLLFRAFVPRPTKFVRCRRAEIQLQAMIDPKRVRHEAVSLRDPPLDIEGLVWVLENAWSRFGILSQAPSGVQAGARSLSSIPDTTNIGRVGLSSAPQTLDGPFRSRKPDTSFARP